jgi:hypothetical protein
MSLTNLLRRIIKDRADPRRVAAVRIVIGINAMICALDEWRKLSRVLAPGILPLPFVEWLPRLSLKALPLFMVAWLGAAISFTIGWKTRFAGALLFCLTGYTLLLDQQTYSNHLYLLVLIVLLLTIADSGAVFALEAQGRGRWKSIPAWPLLLLKIQVSVVYGFSALAKITPGYLSGTVLSRNLRQSGFLVVPQSWRVPAAMSFVAVISIVLELFLALGLWVSRLHLIAVLTCVVFHALLIATLNSHRVALGIFAVEMIALYSLFLDASYVRGWMGSRLGVRPTAEKFGKALSSWRKQDRLTP